MKQVHAVLPANPPTLALIRATDRWSNGSTGVVQVDVNVATNYRSICRPSSIEERYSRLLLRQQPAVDPASPSRHL